MRALYFEQIVDSRFDEMKNMDNILQQRTNLIVSELNKIKNIKIILGCKYDLNFNDNDKTYQIRQEFYILKNTRKITWNDIYTTINKIKPTYYKFINM